jgi:hypothetical protein
LAKGLIILSEWHKNLEAKGSISKGLNIPSSLSLTQVSMMRRKIMRYMVAWDEHYAEGDGFFLFSNRKDALKQYKELVTSRNSNGDEIIFAKIERHATVNIKEGKPKPNPNKTSLFPMIDTKEKFIKEIRITV